MCENDIYKMICYVYIGRAPKMIHRPIYRRIGLDLKACSMLEALIDHDTYSNSVCSCPRVPQLEAVILHLVRLLSPPFGFLDAKDINNSPQRCIS